MATRDKHRARSHRSYRSGAMAFGGHMAQTFAHAAGQTQKRTLRDSLMGTFKRSADRISTAAHTRKEQESK